MRFQLLGVCAFLAGGVFGCSSQGDVDIGDDHSAKVGTTLSDYQGRWEGYLEAFDLPDGTDRVRLSLDSMGNGHIELGNDAPALPQPDPEQAPPGWQYVNDTWSAPSILTGYPFSVTSARVENRRVKLTTQSPIEYQQWCALQTASESIDSTPEAPLYRCLPKSRGVHFDHDNCSLFFDDGPDVPISCGKAQCLFACTCTASQCSWNEDSPYAFDAALEDDGNALVGTLTGHTGRVTARLERR